MRVGPIETFSFLFDVYLFTFVFSKKFDGNVNHFETVILQIMVVISDGVDSSKNNHYETHNKVKNLEQEKESGGHASS